MAKAMVEVSRLRCPLTCCNGGDVVVYYGHVGSKYARELKYPGRSVRDDGLPVWRSLPGYDLDELFVYDEEG